MKGLLIVCLLAAVQANAAFTYTPKSAPPEPPKVETNMTAPAPVAPAPVASAPASKVQEKALPDPNPVINQALGAMRDASTIRPVGMRDPSVVSTPNHVSTPSFVLKKGSLKKQLEKFAKANGHQLSWTHTDDLLIANETTFHGSFEEILSSLFNTLFEIGRKDIAATIFRGNRTIVVERNRR